MADYVISKIQINEDTLELKDATARSNISALTTTSNTHTSKITTLETTTNGNSGEITTLKGKVTTIENALANADHYNITVDSANETLKFNK